MHISSGFIIIPGIMLINNSDILGLKCHCGLGFVFGSLTMEQTFLVLLLLLKCIIIMSDKSHEQTRLSVKRLHPADSQDVKVKSALNT